MSTSSSDPSNYEYVTTRVRVRKSKLFDEDDYRKLVRMGTNEIARYMEEREYEDEINALGSRHSGVDLIEYALYDNMSSHFQDIVRWSEGELHDLVVSYLRRYDAWNVKTVLRGVYTEGPVDRVRENLIPAGNLDEEFLEELAELDDIEQVVEELSDTFFGDALRDAYPEYDDTGLLIPLENAVDRAFYDALLSEDTFESSGTGSKQVYTDFLRAEIDLTNIRNALRAAGSESIEPAEYIIEGGDLFTESELERLVDNREELIDALRESEYGDILEDAIDDLQESGSLVEFDRA
ncbi:MAG: ATP synthase A1 subunit C, partial [Halobacteria archaeon]|nr:ATP synthase A1 subunit C [Halobacteria archaeon]